MAHAHLLYREEHLSNTQGCTTTQQHYEGAQCTFIFCTQSSVYRDIVFHSVLHNVTTSTTVKIFPMSWPDVLCTTCTVQRRGPSHHMSHTPRACQHFGAAKLDELLDEELSSAVLLCEHSAINVCMYVYVVGGVLCSVGACWGLCTPSLVGCYVLAWGQPLWRVRGTRFISEALVFFFLFVFLLF